MTGTGVVGPKLVEVGVEGKEIVAVFQRHQQLSLGLGHASFDALREEIEKLGAPELKDLCRRLLRPDRLTTVVVN